MMEKLRDEYKRLSGVHDVENKKANDLADPHWNKAGDIAREMEVVAGRIFLTEFANTVKWRVEDCHIEGRVIFRPAFTCKPLHPFEELLCDSFSHGGLYLDEEHEVYFGYNDQEYHITFNSFRLALDFVEKNGVAVDTSEIKGTMKKLQDHMDSLGKLLEISQSPTGDE